MPTVEKYIQMIEKNDIKICLDICHVILSANSNGADYNDWLARLMPYSRHLHVSEAIGEDGEGLGAPPPRDPWTGGAGAG